MAHRLAVPITSVALLIAFPAFAQTQGAVSTTDVFDQTFFKGVNLSTAEDMLRRIPGAAAVLDAQPSTANQARGLGAGAEQVLIDGKRMASKSTTASAMLRRIPASSVERVEMIRGSSGEVQSEGLVINVVLKAGRAVGGTGNFEIAYRATDQGRDDLDGLVSYASQWRGVSYGLGYEHNAWSPIGTAPTQGLTDFTTRFRDERYFYPSGVLQELRPQKWRRVHQKDIVTFNATLPFGEGDDAFRINALYQTNPVKTVDITAVSRFSNLGAPTSRATEDHYNKSGKDTLELGSELDLTVGPGALKAILLHSRSQADSLDFRNRTEANGALAQLARSVNEQATGENVLRATYALPVSRAHKATFGVEGARNFLTQEIGVFFDLDRDGRLEQIVVPTALAKVKELRGEVSIKDNWQISSKWTLESTLAFEVSHIETNYPAIPVRTLSYLKPRFDLRYNRTARDRIRIRVERTVGQLDFANFVPAYNVVDSRIDLGNPEIRPNEIRTIEAGYEHRLSQDKGTLGSRLIYRVIIGNPNFTPFGVNAAGLPQSRRGNVGAVVAYGFENTASVRIPGLEGAQVNARLLYQPTRTRDQFTFLRRKAAGIYNGEVSLGFRQDLAALKASYGVDFISTSGPQLISDVRTAETATRSARVNLFVERALGGGYSIRFDAYNINGAEEDRQRRLYTVSQINGALLRTETYHETRDRRFALRLRGKF